jgi:hypothetical protein
LFYWKITKSIKELNGLRKSKKNKLSINLVFLQSRS